MSHPLKGVARPTLAASLPRATGSKIKMADATIEEQAKMFNDIRKGRDATYRLDKEPDSWSAATVVGEADRVGRRVDFDGDTRQCYVIRGLGSAVVFNVRGAASYRMAFAARIVKLCGGGEADKTLADMLTEKFARIGRQKNALLIRHMCGNGECCNAYHLKLGTQAENGADAAFHLFARRSDVVKQTIWDEFEETRELW